MAVPSPSLNATVLKIGRTGDGYCIRVEGSGTTRESRALLLVMTISAVAVLRFVGFGSTIFAAQKPMAVVILYASVATALVLGAIAISRGRGMEPPAFLTNAIAGVTARLARTAGAHAT